MRNRKKLFLKLSIRATQFTLAVLIFLQMNSCAYKKVEATCTEIVLAAMESETKLPAGTLYSLSASEGEKGYMSESFIFALYGKCDTTLWLDASIYISNRLYPCEIAVIHCDSPTTAEDTAKLFCKRLTVLQNSWESSDTEYNCKSEVFIVRNYVAMIVSSDIQNTKRIILNML